MTTPEKPPEQPQFLRNAFTTKIGGWNRFLLPVGFFTVAILQDTWVALVLAGIWTLTAQMTLYDCYLRGWMDGFGWCQAHTPGRLVAMEDLLDLCDRHGVPPQEVADLVWKENR